jgi:hypothetical protein
MKFRNNTPGMALTGIGLLLGLSLGLAACGGNSTVADDPDSAVNNNNTNTADCGNGVIETGEDCDTTALGGQDCEDLNLGTGELTCTDTCSFNVSGCSEQPDCGNGELEYGETCDGSDLGGASCSSLGYASGDLTCDANCNFDVSSCESCGNDVADNGEQCDGADLGGETCASQSLGTGDLACSTSCTFDVSDCSDQPECGDDIAEGTEVCDGTDLRGEDCTDHGFVGGVLICTGTCTFDDSGCSNCETPDNTDPVASNHVPAPETQGAPETTAISADLFDSCGVDPSSVTMRITITPKFGPAQVLAVTPTVTGTGTNVSATYTHPGGFSAGDIVGVMLSATDINGNTLVETWRFSVVDSMTLYTGGTGGVPLANAIDEALPDTNYAGFSVPELIGRPAGSERRYLLQFNPVVPVGALILSATLSAGVCSAVSGAATLDCYQLNADSQSTQSTWNNRSSSVTWTVAGADDIPADRSATMAGTIPFNTATPQYTWVSDNVTALVTNWAAGDGFYGIVCMNESTTHLLPICSPFSNAPPKIDLTFGPALP